MGWGCGVVSANTTESSHYHCAEGACEGCDCCAAGWCINFEDGSPWDDALGLFKCITPYPEPGSPNYQHAVEQFDIWSQIACESRGFEVRSSSGVEATAIAGDDADDIGGEVLRRALSTWGQDGAS